MKRLFVQQIWNFDYEADTDIDENMHVYKVTKVTNSVEPYVGQELSRSALQEYCAHADWDVVIT